MNSRVLLATLVGLAAATVVVPAGALAQIPIIGDSDINLGIQVVGGQASTSNTVVNDADMDLSFTSGSASAANCQWAVGYNVQALSLVSVDGFGLIDDSDELEGELEGGLFTTRDVSAEDDVELDTVTSDASCDQTLGTIRIIDDRANGWGEAAPSGDALNSLATTLGAWPGTSSANAVIQVVTGSAYVDDTVVNNFYADLSFTSGVAAAANCQWVVGVDVVATSIAKVEGKFKIEDKDESEVEIEPGLPSGNLEELGGDITAEDDVEDDSEYATATCTQKVDLIEFLLGGTDTIRPAS